MKYNKYLKFAIYRRFFSVNNDINCKEKYCFFVDISEEN